MNLYTCSHKCSLSFRFREGLQRIFTTLRIVGPVPGGIPRQKDEKTEEVREFIISSNDVEKLEKIGRKLDRRRIDIRRKRNSSIVRNFAHKFLARRPVPLAHVIQNEKFFKLIKRSCLIYTRAFHRTIN